MRNTRLALGSKSAVSIVRGRPSSRFLAVIEGDGNDLLAGRFMPTPVLLLARNADPELVSTPPSNVYPSQTERTCNTYTQQYQIRPSNIMGITEGGSSPRNLAPTAPPHLLVHALVLLAARTRPRERVHLALRLARRTRQRRLRATVQPKHRHVHLFHLFEAAHAVVVADVVDLHENGTRARDGSPAGGAREGVRTYMAMRGGSTRTQVDVCTCVSRDGRAK